MDELLRKLQGSEARDIFKRTHKDMQRNANYAADIDLILLEKRWLNGQPFVDPVALLDYKRGRRDYLTFAEVGFYNAWLPRMETPIYIIRGPEEANGARTGPFIIERYYGGDFRPQPPRCDLRVIGQVKDWRELELWEIRLRKELLL